MPDPIFDSALLSMCMTWRHDFGLMDRKEQMEVKKTLLGLYEHHVKPALDRASRAESELVAMRQRAEEAEQRYADMEKRFVSAHTMLKDMREQLGLSRNLMWHEVIDEAGRIKSNMDAAIARATLSLEPWGGPDGEEE